MNFRKTAILFGIVAVALTVLLITTLWEGDTPTDGGLIAGFATGISEKDVDTVEIARTDPTDDKLVFVRTGEKSWELRQPSTSFIDSAHIEAIIRAIWGARPTIYQGLTDNVHNHGLGSPTYKITLKSKAERSVTVNVGDTTIGGAGAAVTFVTTSERPDKPVAIRTADLRPIFRDREFGKDGKAAALSRWLADFRTKRLFRLEMQNPGFGVEKIKLTQGTSALALTNTKGTWTFDLPSGYGDAEFAGDTTPKPDGFTGVRPLLNVLASLQTRNADDYIENVETSNYGQFGLDTNDPNVVRIEIQSRGDKPEVVYFGKTVMKDNKPVVPTQIYARKEGDSAVMLLTTDRLPAITNTIKNPTDLRNRDLMTEVNKDRVNAFDITTGGESFRLRRVGSHWYVYGGKEPRFVQGRIVKAMLDQIGRPRVATQMLTGDQSAAFAPQEIKAEVKVYLGTPSEETPSSATVPEEPKLTTPALMTLTVGKSDGDGTFLRKATDNSKVEMKVSAETTAGLTLKRVDFIDSKIGGFDITKAEKLSFNRGKELFELHVHKEPDPAYPRGRWDFVLPATVKGKTSFSDSISGMLQMLYVLQLARVHSDTATPDDLKKWGLTDDTVRMKVTVDADEKGKVWTYLLGYETEDKKAMYVQLVGQPFVLIAPKSMLEEFATADLRERLIFRTDPLKVNKIQLVGWKAQNAGKPITVTLTKKDRDWTSDRPDFTVDPNKLKILLEVLRYPQTIDFVAEVRPVEWGLAPENGSLTVTLWQDGVKDPVWIDLSSVEQVGKPGIYASSSGMPNQVFKVESGRFRKFVEDMKSLTK